MGPDIGWWKSLFDLFSRDVWGVPSETRLEKLRVRPSLRVLRRRGAFLLAAIVATLLLREEFLLDGYDNTTSHRIA